MRDSPAYSIFYVLFVCACSGIPVASDAEIRTIYRKMIGDNP